MLPEGKGANEVSFIGKCTSDFRFSHYCRGEKFYKADFVSERSSGIPDCIPVMVSAGQRDKITEIGDNYVWIKGQFRSFNCTEQGKKRMLLYVFAETVDFFAEETEYVLRNYIYLEGYVCKETIYRTTPGGMKITDIVMAVQRPSGGADYIPCISWGKYALRAAKFSVGEHIWLKGRIQSRYYSKKTEDGSTERRIAYEVSAFEVEVFLSPKKG